MKIDSSELKVDLSKYDRSFNDMALWLSGIEQDSNGVYKDLQNSETWKNYCFDINNIK